MTRIAIGIALVALLSGCQTLSDGVRATTEMIRYEETPWQRADRLKQEEADRISERNFELLMQEEEEERRARAEKERIRELGKTRAEEFCVDGFGPGLEKDNDVIAFCTENLAEKMQNDLVFSLSMRALNDCLVERFEYGTDLLFRCADSRYAKLVDQERDRIERAQERLARERRSRIESIDRERALIEQRQQTDVARSLLIWQILSRR